MWRAQIENEYGFCPFNDKVYLRHLVDLARKALGSDAVLFTTDPPQVTEIGSLRGEEVLTCAPRLVHGLGLKLARAAACAARRCSCACPTLAVALAVPTLSFEPLHRETCLRWKH